MTVLNSETIRNAWTQSLTPSSPLESLGARDAAALIAQGIAAGQSADLIALSLITKLPPQTRNTLPSDDVTSFVTGLLNRLNVSQENPDAGTGTTFATWNGSSDKKIDVGFGGTIKTVTTGEHDVHLGTLQTRFDADARHAHAAAKGCLVEASWQTSEDTKISVSALCAEAEAGINPLGLVGALKKGDFTRQIVTFKEKASLVEFTGETAIKADDGCTYKMTGQIGLGSIGPGIKVGAGEIGVYDGAGLVGIGASIKQECPE